MTCPMSGVEEDPHTMTVRQLANAEKQLADADDIIREQAAHILELQQLLKRYIK